MTTDNMNKHEFIERLREVWERSDLSFSELMANIFPDEINYIPDRIIIERLESLYVDKEE